MMEEINGSSLSIFTCRVIGIVWLVLAVISPAFGQINNSILLLAHAHNDYEQSNPLFEALSHGFTSIEVDIHPYKDALKVSHTRFGCLRKKKNIDELYLKPLDSLVFANGGTVFDKDSTQLTLMMDLKTKKKKALNLLHQFLLKHDHLFHKSVNGIERWGPVMVLISGSPPLHEWQKINSPYFFLDARIGTTYPPEVKKRIKRISGHINSITSMDLLINGDIQEMSRLKQIVGSVYKLGYPEFRFWGTRDDEKTWEFLLSIGVNKISVDDLSAFAKFYAKHIDR